MKYKLLFIALFTIASLGVSAQTTVFDPATFEGTLPANAAIVDIGGTDYLRVVLDGGYPGITLDSAIEVTEATHFIAETKLELVDSDSLDVTETYTFLKLADASWGDLAAESNISHAALTEDTVEFAVQGVITILQYTGQDTTTGGPALSGDTLWIGKIDVYPRVGQVATQDTLVCENHLDGDNIRDDSDFLTIAEVTWDVDSLYVKFTVWDDTIFNDGGDTYKQDNLELYLDMDDSKGTDFDQVDDFQFRFMNDSTWTSVNSDANDIGNGYRLDYEVFPAGGAVDTAGYTYDIAICFDSLVWADAESSFIPSVGAQIGFDILASDNDGTPVFRDQVSWNSISGDLWKTPGYWGVLQLEEGGKVGKVEDTEAPTAPSDLAAVVDDHNVDLDWEASTDNRLVASYTVLQDGAPIDTVASSSFTVADLEVGTYVFSVFATDIYGLMSDTTTTVDAEILTGIINVPSAKGIVVYPNPASDILKIKTEGSIETIEIADISGKTLLRATNVKEINVNALKKGVYFIKVKTENDIYSSKFVKE